MGAGARIEAVAVSVLTFPLERPFRAAIRTIPTVDCVLVELRIAGGAGGLGYGFAFGVEDAMLLAAFVSRLSGAVVGENAFDHERLWRRMWDALVFLGQSGAGVSAIATIDLALWDAKGRMLGVPLHKLLGAARDTVRCYGSGGSLAADTPALVAEMADYVRRGFPAVKLKLGHGLAEDRARVAAVREAIGPDVRLIADANQQWSPKQALRAASALAVFDLWWLEEPVAAADIEAAAEVRRGAPMPIATGETNFSPAEFDRILGAGAADILMPNLQRVGGITPWLKIAGAAHLRGLPVASHIYAEINAHLMCAIPNGLTLEIVEWWPRLFVEALDIRGGHAAPPSGAGFGLTLDAAIVARHKVA